MAEDYNTLKTQLEVKKLQREYELNLEFEKLQLEKVKSEAEERRQKKEFRKSIIAMILPNLCILITAYVAFLSYKTNSAIGMRGNLERYDKLRSLYYSNSTNELKAAIAYELGSVDDRKILSQEEQSRFLNFYNEYKSTFNRKDNRIKNDKKIAVDKIAKTPEKTKKLLATYEVKQQNLVQQIRNLKKQGSSSNTIQQHEIQLANLQKEAEKIPAVVAVQALSSSQTDLNNFTNSNSGAIVASKWVKENYYVDFEKIYISLVELPSKSKSGLGTIKIYNDDDDVIASFNFVVPDKKSFTYQNHRYELTFDKVDYAGINFTKKALYFTVSKF